MHVHIVAAGIHKVNDGSCEDVDQQPTSAPHACMLTRMIGIHVCMWLCLACDQHTVRWASFDAAMTGCLATVASSACALTAECGSLGSLALLGPRTAHWQCKPQWKAT